ncbi:MAG: hypothetical protein N2652_00395 [Kiritimatiellae bacterium]|nr:hypothetical protein [Kiritimatiellia bacterium]
MRGNWLLAFCSLSVAAAAAESAERFPFVIPGDDIAANATDFSHLVPRPAGADGFVTIRDGRFYVGDRRLRFWGMNVCFAANAPEKSVAPKVAARLVKLGINAVRFHHHDTQPPPRGLLRPPENGVRRLDPEMLDRQDFFLDQLHRHGIYANLNLHVGRSFTEAEGFENVGDLPYECRFAKYLLYFEPRMRQRLKEFIREYLGHVNPYRQLRRAEDPAIALVELTNENSFSERGPGLAKILPEPYRSEFRRQFNAWLQRKYQSTEALKRAWLSHLEPPGRLLASLDGSASRLAPWTLNTPRSAPAIARFGVPGPDGRHAVRIELPAPAPAGAHHELIHSGLSVTSGRTYSVTFAVRADRSRNLYVDVSRQGPANWGPLGWSERLRIGPEWLRVARQFRATDTVDGRARLCFKFGESDVDFELADVEFREGGLPDPFSADQRLETGTVEIPYAGLSDRAWEDARAFMVDTEREFIRDLITFIRRDCGARMPITASQITYHGARIVADTCDYADAHAYWHHPRFPRRPWDRDDWTIGNTPMEEAIEFNPLFERATWRLLDRPFTLSEWNIPAPHDYAASAVPFAALAAALQDWDGVFFFQYSSDADEWFRDRISGYFSFNGHPAKLALLGVFAHLYLRGDLPPLPEVAAGTCERRLPPMLGLTHRIGISPAATSPAAVSPPPTRRVSSPDNAVVWDATAPPRAHLTVNTPATRAAWGRVAGQRFQFGGCTLAIGPVERDYAVVALTSMDGRPLEISQRMLLVAVGSAENPDMRWNESRTSVGRHWGRGPTHVNGIPARIELQGPPLTVRALDGRGEPTAELKVSATDSTCSFDIGPEHRTLWYDLRRR